jgi:hypothetical protein
MELENKTVTELLLIRQWLYSVNGNSIDSSRLLADAQLDVDKELWSRILGGESPWERRKRYSPLGEKE